MHQQLGNPMIHVSNVLESGLSAIPWQKTSEEFRQMIWGTDESE